MEPTESTTRDTTTGQHGTSDPTADTAHTGIKLAAAAGVAVVSLGAAAAMTPVLALISYNHNETTVASRERRHRWVKTAAGATAAAVAVASLGAAATLTPVLAFIDIVANHNETLVG